MELSYLAPASYAALCTLVLICVYGPAKLREPVSSGTIAFTTWSFLLALVVPTGAYGVWVRVSTGSLDWLIVILVAELCGVAMIITMFAVWLCTLPPYTPKT